MTPPWSPNLWLERTVFGQSPRVEDPSRHLISSPSLGNRCSGACLEHRTSSLCLSSISAASTPQDQRSPNPAAVSRSSVTSWVVQLRMVLPTMFCSTPVPTAHRGCVDGRAHAMALLRGLETIWTRRRRSLSVPGYRSYLMPTMQVASTTEREMSPVIGCAMSHLIALETYVRGSRA